MESCLIGTAHHIFLYLRAGLERLPLELHIKFQSILYGIRLYSHAIYPLVKESFFFVSKLRLCANLFFSWFSFVKHVSEETGMDLDTFKKYSSHKINKTIREQIKLKLKDFYEKRVNDKI